MAIIGELQDKFKQLHEQSTKASKDLQEIGENMWQFQQKVNKRAESLELHIWKISALFDEDRNFGVEGIAKELGTLKGKISEAVTIGLKVNQEEDELVLLVFLNFF